MKRPQTPGVDSGEGAGGRRAAGGGAGKRRGRVHVNRAASLLLITAFVLGVLNAAVMIVQLSGVVSPEETYGSGSCELAGEVRDAAGRPIPNATVLVTDASLSALTDGSGWYMIKGISPGVHRVEATAPGYNRMSVRVDLRPNILEALDFTLEYGGADMSLDEAASAPLSEPAASFLWATPLLLACSICALAAAVLSWHKRPGKLALALALASIPSLGFGPGSAFAAAGSVLLGLHLAGWPRRRAAGPRAASGAPAPEPRPVPAECELVAGEAMGKVAGGAGKPAAAARQPRPLMGVRRAGRERFLCCVCIGEIKPGQRYIKCVCGRRMHVFCVQEPECPECGHPLRREG